ncbi:MAG: hypothetical protein LQ344_002390 [Seirophora lacunosa]|nr:MAG: hypothetical protein LQ344_002390 [Seirophora lacunosa]
MATLAAARDIPILIRSPAACSERRVNPSWTISQLKARLEPITGIAPALQTLAVRQPQQQEMTAISAADEDRTEIGSWSLLAYAELHVASTDPSSADAIPPLSSVPKYEMPVETYSSLPATVLAYKKTHQIGRFDPHAPEWKERKAADLWKEIAEGRITLGARCILSPLTTRRGTVAYVGLIPEIPGVGPWVGVRLDEPAGKNDGSVGGKRYFECGPQYGVFVRPNRVDVGNWTELGLDEGDGDPDEI